MNDYIDAGDPGRPLLVREGRALNRSSAFNVVLIAFAIIGAVAVVGIVGMWAMHAGMMNGIGIC